MTKTIIALYDDYTILRGLVQELLDAGIEREAISLIARDEQLRWAHAAGMETAGETAYVIEPGAGRFEVTGPATAFLGRVPEAVRATGSGLLQALREIGVDDDHAQLYMQGLRRNDLLVMVQQETTTADHIAEIMNRYPLVDLNERVREWRETSHWNGFEGNAEPFAFRDPPQPKKERAAASRLDYGPGASEFIAGQPVSDYDRGQADMGRYTGEDENDTWQIYEQRFRDHFQQRYAAPGKYWEDYRGAYRFGFDMARTPSDPDQPWEVVREYAIQHWRSRNMGQNWDDYADAVQVGWEAARVTN